MVKMNFFLWIYSIIRNRHINSVHTITVLIILDDLFVVNVRFFIRTFFCSLLAVSIESLRYGATYCSILFFFLIRESSKSLSFDYNYFSSSFPINLICKSFFFHFHLFVSSSYFPFSLFYHWKLSSQQLIEPIFYKRRNIFNIFVAADETRFRFQIVFDLVKFGSRSD